jgi:dTDP-4-amino-4,6-dideoxygalactose transaminase
MKVPFCRPDISKATCGHVAATLSSGKLDTGEQVEEFQQRVAAELEVGAEQVVLTSSCTHAIELALRIMQPFETAVRANTWIADVNAIYSAGSRYRLLDCDEDLRVVPGPPNSDAYIHVPLYGSAEPAPIQYPKHTVIEDYAHALGANWARGLPESRFRCFSLAPTKIITAIHGGILVCRHLDDAKDARIMGRQGAMHRTAVMQGCHYNMPDINALVGRWELLNLDYRVQASQSLAERYLDVGVIRRRVPKRLWFRSRDKRPLRVAE